MAALPARAAFQSLPRGADSAALGGASLPAAGDSASIFVNAAGAAALTHADAYFVYDQLYAGTPGVGSISQSFASAAVPTRAGVLGVGFSQFSAAGLLEERALALSLSRRLGRSVEVGVAAKYLYHRYLIGGDSLAAADPVFAGGTARGALALDFGVIATVAAPLRVGFSVRNANRPDVGLASEDRVPREYQAGASWDFAGKGLRATADFTYRDERVGTVADRATPAVGLEKSLEGDRVKFRVGATPHELSAGVGIAFGSFVFDYAFVLARELASAGAGTHSVGLRYRFGGENK